MDESLDKAMMSVTRLCMSSHDVCFG